MKRNVIGVQHKVPDKHKFIMADVEGGGNGFSKLQFLYGYCFFSGVDKFQNADQYYDLLLLSKLRIDLSTDHQHPHGIFHRSASSARIIYFSPLRGFKKKMVKKLKILIHKVLV